MNAGTGTVRPYDTPPILTEAVRWLVSHGHGRPVAAERRTGGTISATHRIRSAEGRSWVIKQGTRLPPDLYAKESVLTSAGTARVTVITDTLRRLLRRLVQSSR